MLRTIKMLNNMENNGWDVINEGNKNFLRINGKRTRLLDRTVTQFTTEPLLSAGAHDRELILLDPKSKYLEEKYQELLRQLPDEMNPILIKVMAFVRNNLLIEKNLEEKVDNFLKNFQPRNTYKSQPVIALDEFIKNQIGVCRHHAFFLAYLVDRLIQDKKLPAGQVFHHRDNIQRGAHVWVMYQPDVLINQHEPYTILWLDSLWDTNVYSLFTNKALLISKGYGKDAVDKCVAHYVPVTLNEPYTELSNALNYRNKRIFIRLLLNENFFDRKKFIALQGTKKACGDMVSDIETGPLAAEFKEHISYQSLLNELKCAANVQELIFSEIDNEISKQQFIICLLVRDTKDCNEILKKQDIKSLEALRVVMEDNTSLPSTVYRNYPLYIPMLKLLQDLIAQKKNQPYEVISFTYFKRTARRGSFCKIRLNNGTEETHDKGQLLGKGGFGDVYTFGNNYVVKSFVAKFNTLSGQAILEDSNRIKIMCRKEAEYNQKIHGLGYAYQTTGPILYKYSGGIKEVESYPQNYLLMPRIPGTPWYQFKFDSINAYVECAIAALTTLRDAFHAKDIIHSDIKNDNLLIESKPSGEYKVTIIDMSLTAKSNELIKITDLNLKIKPPEFQLAVQKKHDWIPAKSNQDIYCMGLVFSATIAGYASLFGSSNVLSHIYSINKSMLNDNPSKRLSCQEALDAYVEIKLKIKRDTLLKQFGEKQHEYFNNFSGENIDKWCYCQRFITLLIKDKRSPQLSVSLINSAEIGFNKLDCASWENSLGAKRLINYVLNNDVNMLNHCLQLLSHSENKLELLQHLHAHNKNYFAELLDTKEKLSTFLLFNVDISRNKLLNLFLESKFAKITQELKENPSNIILLDMWCYIQSLLCDVKALTNIDIAFVNKLLGPEYEQGKGLEKITLAISGRCLNHTLFRDLDQTVQKSLIKYLGIENLKSLTKNGKGLQDVLAELNNENKQFYLKILSNHIANLQGYIFYDSNEIDSFFVNLCNSVEFKTVEAAALTMSRQIFNQYTHQDWRKNFKSAIAYLDNTFKKQSPELYQLFLKAFVSLYQEKRFADDKQYYTSFGCHLFGRWSKDEKLNQIQSIHEAIMKGDFNNLSVAATSGLLGELTSRCKQSMRR